MDSSIAQTTTPCIWYATYLADDRSQTHGTATYTAQGWTFTAEGGIPMANVTLHDLCLLGHVPLADEQQRVDRARLAQAWTEHMLRAGCQVRL